MFWLLLIFIVVPIAELYVIIQIGGAIGVPLTLAILLADALIGSLLLRHQGRSAWRRFNLALEERRFPGREVADGVAITVGGTLLLTPGFITDVFGLILLIPPTRAVVRKIAWVLMGSRFKLATGAAGAASWGYGRMRQNGGGTDSGRRAGGYDVDGTAQEVAPEESDRPERPTLPPA